MISKNTKEFVKHMKSHCQNHGIELYMPKAPYILANGFKCSGYFESDEKKLSVAVSDDESMWVSTLAHEASHMDQWIENSKWWNCTTNGPFDANEMIDMWLGGYVELTDTKKHKYIKSIMDCEFDCEKRTVEKIKEFDLPVDPIQYTKGAISYIWMYKVVEATRKWCKKAPYKIQAVVDGMPDTFPSNINSMRPYHFNLIKKHSF